MNAEASAIFPGKRGWTLGAMARVALACPAVLLELVRSRFALASIGPADIAALNRAAEASASGLQMDDDRPGFIAYVLPRVAARLPWRSDCLIQAMAAQRWLQRSGIATRIVIGVDQPKDGPFVSHAWLEYRGERLIGGDIARYQVILGDEIEPPDGLREPARPAGVQDRTKN